MGANKKWKRKAKRIKGYCMAEAEMCRIGNMNVCEYFHDCKKVSPTKPCEANIRELEINYLGIESINSYTGEIR